MMGSTLVQKAMICWCIDASNCSNMVVIHPNEEHAGTLSQLNFSRTCGTVTHHCYKQLVVAMCHYQRMSSR